MKSKSRQGNGASCYSHLIFFAAVTEQRLGTIYLADHLIVKISSSRRASYRLCIAFQPRRCSSQAVSPFKQIRYRGQLDLHYRIIDDLAPRTIHCIHHLTDHRRSDTDSRCLHSAKNTLLCKFFMLSSSLLQDSPSSQVLLRYFNALSQQTHFFISLLNTRTSTNNHKATSATSTASFPSLNSKPPSKVSHPSSSSRTATAPQKAGVSSAFPTTPAQKQVAPSSEAHAT